MRNKVLSLGVCTLVFALGLGVVFPTSALGYMAGKSRYEYSTDWRGVQSMIWLYPWSLSYGNGKHVSSIYIRDDDATDRHVETGIVKNYNTSAMCFYQWCKVVDLSQADWGTEWYQYNYSLLSGSGYYTTFEINNVDMGGSGDPGDNWRVAKNGTVMTTVYMPGIIAGDATCSSEVNAEGSDDNRSSFRDLKKKNNSGSWSLWVDSRVYPLADEDTTYCWSSYSASHWYTYEN